MKWWKVMHLSLLVAAAVALGSVRAYGQTSAYELCIEESPIKAGKLTPDPGTHRFSVNSIVTLSAEPQPGYQFAYWLGDVADPKSQRTTVQVNSPKVVVAVFQIADKDYLDEKVLVGGGGGGGGAAPTSLDLSTPAWSSPGGGKSQTVVIPVPIQTPEPVTIVLLSLGALAARRRLR